MDHQLVDPVGFKPAKVFQEIGRFHACGPNHQFGFDLTAIGQANARGLEAAQHRTIGPHARALEVEDLFRLFNLNGTARKIHPGRMSILAPVREELSAFVFHLREQGIQCTNRMVGREASRLLPAFCEKSSTAQEQVVRRFTKYLGLTQRMATHNAQKHFRETKDSSRDFIAMMRERTINRNRDDILNFRF